MLGTHKGNLIGGVVVALAFSTMLTGCFFPFGVEKKCADGDCITECVFDSDCKGDEFCNADELCQTKDVKPDPCESLQDCGPAQICGDASLCVDVDTCGWDGDCNGNQRCNFDEGCLATGSGDGLSLAVCLGFCDDDDTPLECYGDFDCAAGEFCDFSNPTAGFQPGSDEAGAPMMMEPGTCQPKPTQYCWGQDECGEGRYCARLDTFAPMPAEGDGNAGAAVAPPEGICRALPTGACITDANCTNGAECSLGKTWGPTEPGTCQQDLADCWGDFDCGAGTWCSPYDEVHSDKGEPSDSDGAMMEAPMGVCVDLPADRCLSDNDCNGNDYCNHADPMAGPGWCMEAITYCGSDNDCAPGEFCDWAQDGSGADAGPPLPVPAQGICQTKEPVFCWGDFDCAEDEYCEYDVGTWTKSSSSACEDDAAPVAEPQSGLCLPQIDENQ